ncbi:MAG: hypothetical protein AB7E47_03295 [Desulfovibrionaceae bacterium]
MVCADAPCLHDDLAALGEIKGFDLIAVNRAALKVAHPINYLVTLHWYTHEIEQWREQRKGKGWNDDYLLVGHEGRAPVGVAFPFRAPSGSSSLFACLFALSIGYERVVLAGGPLDHPGYHDYREGWRAARRDVRGRVISLSGWTREFCKGATC